MDQPGSTADTISIASFQNGIIPFSEIETVLDEILADFREIFMTHVIHVRDDALDLWTDAIE